MSVFSKIVDRTSAKCGIRQEQLTRGVVGVATVLYLLKLGYPHIVARVKRRRANCTSETAKLSSSRENESEEDEDETEKALLAEALDSDSPTGDRNIIAAKVQAARLNLGLDRAFVKQLLTLLKIMVPGWRTREAGLLTCATFTLLARTFISVYVAALEGQIVKRIVLKDVRGFFHMLARWFAIALPATFVNSAIRYLEGRLALSFRYILFFLTLYYFFFFFSFLHRYISRIFISRLF